MTPAGEDTCRNSTFWALAGAAGRHAKAASASAATNPARAGQPTTAVVRLFWLFPFMASDYCVMIPTMMALILAGSPLHRFAGEKPTCRRCSLELDPGRKAGTGVFKRPAAREGSAERERA